MTWYAAQTRPGALRPSQARGGRTRLQCDLEEAGIAYFLPMERRAIIHRRTRKRVWNETPLVPGYVFLENVRDWPALDQIESLGPVIRNKGNPVIISVSDIDRLEKAQEAINALHEEQERKRILASQRPTARRLASMYPAGSTVRIKSGLLAGREAVVQAATGRATVRAIAEMLGGVVEVELPVEALDFDREGV